MTTMMLYQQVQHAAVRYEFQSLFSEVLAYVKRRRLQYRCLADTSRLSLINSTRRRPY